MAARARNGGDDALTAAASVLPADAYKARLVIGRSQDVKWQEDAVLMYHMLGELRYAARYAANSFGLIRFFVGTRNHPGQQVVPIPDDPAEEGEPDVSDVDAQMRDSILRIKGRDGSFLSLLRTYALQQYVVGEGFLVGLEGVDGDTWEVASTTEVRKIMRNGVEVTRRIDNQGDEVDIPPGAVIIRMWQRDPFERQRADSSVRSVLTLCESLVTAQAIMTAGDRSRLASDGILFVPDDADLPRVSNDEGPSRVRIYDDLMQLALIAMDDPGSAAAALPLVVPMNSKYIEFVKHVTFAREIDATIQNRIEHLVERLAQGLDINPEKIRGVSGLSHWCTSDDTDILTRDRGWVRHGDLAIGDAVRTLNHETGLAEWQPVEHIYRADVVDEPMLAIETQNHSSLSTSEHRWPTIKSYSGARQWKFSRQLGENDSIITAAPSADCPTEAKHSDEFVELTAWMWTEGWRSKPGAKVASRITQSHTCNPERVDRIRGVLTRLFGPPPRKGVPVVDRPTWREDWAMPAFGGACTIFRLNAVATRMLDEVMTAKRPNPEFIASLTRAQLELFIDVSCQGDGHHYRQGRLDIWQKVDADLDAYEMALILSGRATNRRPEGNGHHVSALKNAYTRPAKAAYESQRTGCADSRMGEEHYTGVVWCPTTANGTWLARRRGTVYYTGNSSWEVSEDFINAHVQPMAQNFCEDLTIGYLRPYAEALKAKGVDVDPDRYALGFTTADLIASPNRDEHAKWLFGQKLLAGDATIEALGFSTDAKMGPEEIEEWIRVAQASGASATAGQVSEHPVTDPPEPPPDAPAVPPPSSPGEPPAPTPDDPADKGPPAEKPKAPPSDRPPERQAAEAAAHAEALGLIVGWSEVAVDRALERAGGRLREKIKRHGSDEVQTFARVVENPNLTALLGEVKVTELVSVEVLLKGAWDGIRPRIASVAGNPFVTDNIVTAVDNAARVVMFNPNQQARPLIEAAVRKEMESAGALVTA